VNSIKIKISGIAAIAMTCFVAFNCQAANWLMLQGTEPDSAAARAYLWGFVQVQYQNDNSDANSSDGYIPPKLIGPNLESQEQFNVKPRPYRGARDWFPARWQDELFFAYRVRKQCDYGAG